MKILVCLLASLVLVAQAHAGVCDRSPLIRDALIKATDSPCGEIDDSKLAQVTALLVTQDEGDRRIGGFESSDLAGLTSLEELYFSDALELQLKFPTGFFYGLSRLKILEFGRRELYVSNLGNQDALKDLVQLERLVIRGNVEEYHIKPLTNLVALNLEIGNNYLHSIKDLSKLKELQLSIWSSGSESYFEGLDELESLTLEFYKRDAEIPGEVSDKLLRPLGKLRKFLLRTGHKIPAKLFAKNPELERVVLEVAGDLPERVFKGLLKLTDLSIVSRARAIPEKLFSNLGLRTLKVRCPSGDLYFPIGVFDGLSTLEALSVSSQGYVVLDGHSFDSLGNLKHLSLGTKLTTLPQLSALSNLQILNLGGANLPNSTIGVTTFKGLTSLEYLFLQGNKVSNLYNSWQPNGEQIFDGLNRLKEVMFERDGVSAEEQALLMARYPSVAFGF